MTETIETIDITEPDQVNQDPIIESIPDVENEQEQPEAEAPGVQDEPLADVPEEQAEPDLAEKIGEAIKALADKIDEITNRIEALSSIVDNINNLEEARAAGPQGFFKPVGGDAPDRPADPLPRIEKIYK